MLGREDQVGQPVGQVPAGDGDAVSAGLPGPMPVAQIKSLLQQGLGITPGGVYGIVVL
jgi:hypothetical protein